VKISKAIKNLIAGRKDCGMIPSEEYTQTIDLATEALKQLRRLRNLPFGSPLPPLPGETPEEETERNTKP